MNKETYQKLIDYIFQTCNIFELKKYTTNHIHRNLRVINVILNKKPKDLDITYTKECLDWLYNRFKEDSVIFNKGYQNHYEIKDSTLKEKEYKKRVEENRKTVIENSIFNYINDIATNDFLLRNANHLIYIREDIEVIGDYKNSYYYFKTDNQIKKEIQNINSIYAWQAPYFLEDITFYKNGICWLWSISHEEKCEIVFQKEDKEEYEYLKSIGIEFCEKEFTPTPQEYLYNLKECLKDF